MKLLLVFLLALLSTPAPAQAEPAASVVVLSVATSDAEGWPDGTQAVVAELLSTGFGLRVQRARAALLNELSEELRDELSVADVAGAVAVFRRGARGVAWVYDRRFGLEVVETDASGGTLATSRFVLRVVELLREVSIDAQPKPAPPPATPAKPAAPAPERARSPGPLRFWLSGGGTFAGGLSRPMPLVSGSAAVGLWPLLGAELSLSLAPGTAPASARAGEVSLRAHQATAFITFDPLPRSRVGFVLGLGGGLVGASATAQPSVGYAAREASSRVGVVSARARAFLTWKRLQLVLGVDPGLLVPALSITAPAQPALSIGRPWLVASAGVGVSL